MPIFIIHIINITKLNLWNIIYWWFGLIQYSIYKKWYISPVVKRLFGSHPSKHRPLSKPSSLNWNYSPLESSLETGLDLGGGGRGGPIERLDILDADRSNVLVISSSARMYPKIRKLLIVPRIYFSTQLKITKILFNYLQKSSHWFFFVIWCEQIHWLATFRCPSETHFWHAPDRQNFGPPRSFL